MVDAPPLHAQLCHLQAKAAVLQWELDLERRVSQQARVELLKGVNRGSGAASLEVRVLRTQEELTKQRARSEQACQLMKKGNLLAMKEKQSLAEEIAHLKGVVAQLLDDKQTLLQKLEDAELEISNVKQKLQDVLENETRPQQPSLCQKCELLRAMIIDRGNEAAMDVGVTYDLRQGFEEAEGERQQFGISNEPKNLQAQVSAPECSENIRKESPTRALEADDESGAEIKEQENNATGSGCSGQLQNDVEGQLEDLQQQLSQLMEMMGHLGESDARISQLKFTYAKLLSSIEARKRSSQSPPLTEAPQESVKNDMENEGIHHSQDEVEGHMKDMQELLQTLMGHLGAEAESFNESSDVDHQC